MEPEEQKPQDPQAPHIAGVHVLGAGNSRPLVARPVGAFPWTAAQGTLTGSPPPGGKWRALGRRQRGCAWDLALCPGRVCGRVGVNAERGTGRLL